MIESDSGFDPSQHLLFADRMKYYCAKPLGFNDWMSDIGADKQVG